MKQDFLDAGFAVIDGGHANHPLLDYLKEHYPMVIRDNELDLMQLKTLLGLPIDDKVNGYGLNFIGRNFARAKYQQETDKELVLNTAMSKDIDTTKNLVLKGDNLDGLKILKHYYKGKIKCIYIDPPYNTNGDEFIYPDKFDKEEAEVLGLVDLSEDDFARLDFSFKTKKSHNGWLSFMYPRLLLAQELLSDDGVIFISIDDNEQANLKLLCDDVFGEENFVENYIWHSNFRPDNSSSIERENGQYILCYAKNKRSVSKLVGQQKRTEGLPSLTKNKSNISRLFFKKEWVDVRLQDGLYKAGELKSGYILHNDVRVSNGVLQDDFDLSGRVTWSQSYLENEIKKGTKIVIKTSGFVPYVQKVETSDLAPTTIIPNEEVGDVLSGNSDLNRLFDVKVFTHPKPISLLKYLLNTIIYNGFDSSDIILDFFAGSGTTGHAVMQLNAEDGGHRKFILCQIDEPIDPIKKKDEYKFCLDNNLPPVISSITIERLNRAGENIKANIEQHNAKKDVAESDKKQLPDIGYKVFDSIPAPILTLDEENCQIAFPKEHTNAMSRIYHMIFKVGIDEPTQVLIAIIDECMYKLGSNYYITDSHKVSEDVLLDALKDGRVYIDGWTASLDVSLQSQKNKVQIVF